MISDLEDFKTGWFGVSFGLKLIEIDALIEALNSMKADPDYHFHFRSGWEGEGGIGDVEIYLADDTEKDDLQIDTSPAIYPTR